MNSSFLQKASLVLVALLNIHFINAQSIEKTTTITLSNYPNLKTNQGVYSMNIDGEKKLRIYTSHFIPGKFKNSTTSVGGFSVFSGKDMNSGASLVTNKAFSLNLDSLSSQQFLLSINNRDNYTFEVASPASMIDNKLPITFEGVPYEQAVKGNPILSSIKSQSEQRLIGARFNIETKGAFSIKDPKAYPVFVYAPANSNEESLENANKSTSSLSPQKEKNMELLKGYVKVPQTNIFSTDDNKTFSGVLGQMIEGDKWAEYKNFAFVTFDREGNIIAKDTTSFPYIRSVYYSSIVKDFEGKDKGFVYFFGGMAALGGKKEKDPVENNFQIVYVGLDGKIKFNYTFQKGNPNNKLGIRPIFVIEKDGKLLVWNLMTEKLLVSGSFEILSFDAKAVTTKVNNVTLTEPESQAILQFANNPRSLKMICSNGKASVIKQSLEKKTRPQTSPFGGTINEDYYEFGDLYFATFQDNDKYPTVTSIKLQASASPVGLETVHQNNSEYSGIITTSKQNIFINYSQDTFQTKTIGDSQTVVPLVYNSRFNFTVDKDNRKIYFIYQTTVPHIAKLIKVGY